MEKDKRGHELSRQITRRWRPGDVYSPHDLSEVEMAKWKKRSRPIYDAFDVLDFKPADSYKVCYFPRHPLGELADWFCARQNFSIMSEFMTPMGRIKHSRETGLRPVNQRRIARAIRRSIGMGMMPSVHEHPEILQKRLIKRNEQLSPIRRGPI
jgi:small subunit ribosomal protein S18